MKNFILIFLVGAFLLQGFKVNAQVQKLNSYPAASATIFLDFDGQTVKSYAWRNDTSFVCAPSGMSAAQISEIFGRVAEDYRPFNINVTTDSTVFLKAPVTNRTRIVVTPTSNWYPGVGGIAFIGSFTWGDDIPGFVFSDKLGFVTKNVAEACSHESGHTVGLSHQSTYNGSCTLTEQYSSGSGTGQIGWAPIMGNSYGRNMTGWNFGPTPYGCTLTQDNLTIISSDNGFTYRTDDYQDATGSSSYALTAANFNANGVISTTSDRDAFKFTVVDESAFHLAVNPYSFDNTNNGANLDVKVELYNSSSVKIGSYNPQDIMNVTIDTTLHPGTYYFVVSGVGNEYAPQYGSLGSYSLTGSASKVLPIKDVALSGKENNGLHQFQWNIISDDPIKEQTLEVSTNGVQFESVNKPSFAQRDFTYTPQKTGNLFYRLKVTSVLDQIMYSNVITLKAKGSLTTFVVSTFVRDNISVLATEAYQYRVLDANGRSLAAGKSQAGQNFINAQNLAGGIYFIQLMSGNTLKTERFLKN